MMNEFERAQVEDLKRRIRSLRASNFFFGTFAIAHVINWLAKFFAWLVT